MSVWHLVRHGETQWNAEQRVQGQTDVPLNETGRRQAALTGRRLARVRFRAIYASDMSRARETAEIIAAASESGPRDVVFDARLREVAFGELEGMTWAEIEARGSGLRVRQDQRDLDYRPEGGESYRELLDRLGAFAAALEERHPNDDVLVVGHGAALRALTTRSLRLPDEAFWAISGHGSAGITRIRRRRDGHAALIGWSDVGHLERLDRDSDGENP